MINKNNKTFNKKIHTLNSENVVQKLVLLTRHFLSEFFVIIRAKYFQLKALKAMETLSGEQI